MRDYFRHNKLFASGALASLLGVIPGCIFWVLDRMHFVPENNLERSPILFNLFLALLFGSLVLMPVGGLLIFLGIVAKVYRTLCQNKR